MSKQNIAKKHSGFAIAIAWPETFCKQASNWYDSFLNFIGFAKHNYYKVGHAALVLVDAQNGECRYFDFGRYHTPWKHGRARSEKTDPGLKVNTVAQISASGNELLNFDEILTELQLNAECHGEGAIHASYGQIDYSKALEKAYWFQETSPVPYGPFRYKGSNCSRFVNDCLVAGQPSFWSLLKLRVFVPLTPTPLNNVNAFANKKVLPKLQETIPFCPQPINNKHLLRTTLPEPPKHPKIPAKAQWLSGEGCGSWFHIEPHQANFQITRFTANGSIEFKAIFKLMNANFESANPFKINYLSHFKIVNVMQNNNCIEFSNVLNL